jgi:2-dehydro-3-deoxyphosphogluconate aldolase/(4S)-4-hydroxy-2-oxoglutarate aldolase
MSNEVLNKIEELKLVPVIAIENADDAAALGDALLAGGLACAEVTFRTKAAPDAIKAMSANADLFVGAGTVLTVDQAKQAVDCGARFLVSPGTNPEVVEWAVSNNITIAPGVATPTDIELAMSFGLTTLKFFPAEAFGGLKTLKAMSAPYGDVRFIPTGGISADNLLDYLRFNKVIACGGSWMVKGDLITGHQFDRITELTQQAVTLAAQAS